jgi:Rab family protein
MGCSESKPPPGRDPLSRGEREAKSLEAKIVLLGDTGVGKSSLALRFCQGRFPPFHEVTIGAAFLQQIVRVERNRQLKLYIWDTGGQERFRAMAPLYYRDAAGAIIVYDVTNPSSFDSVKYWVQELQAKGPASVEMAIAANKMDVEGAQHSAEDAKAFAEENGMLFIATSAKSGENVGRLFEQVANKIAANMP